MMRRIKQLNEVSVLEDFVNLNILSKYRSTYNILRKREKKKEKERRKRKRDREGETERQSDGEGETR